MLIIIILKLNIFFFTQKSQKSYFNLNLNESVTLSFALVVNNIRNQEIYVQSKIVA